MPPLTENGLSEVHCCGCGRFLALSAIAVGVIQIKCPRCKAWTTISSLPNAVDSAGEAAYNSSRKAE